MQPTRQILIVLWAVLATTVSMFALQTATAQSNSAAKIETQLAKGLLGHWRLNEMGGSIAHDSSGLDNHGTICRLEREAVNGVWDKPSDAAALCFDGTERYAVIVPHNDKHNLRAPLSVAAWI